MIELFPHNQTAYDKVCQSLARVRKAAVIHPTGTGKSFIAFKLCEDNPQARICWLSPSVYIWKTQLENVKAVNGFEPQNVTFLTYAKLMVLSEAERAEIRPDVIILDEFHRCGAEEWGKGVEALLAEYPRARLLGLSATPIRYLDQQRDMSVELFDGCIAHELSLSEAVVRGILPAPKYVLSIYSFEQELERYGHRVHKVGPAVRKRAELLLERLRRRLNEAESIGKIFENHLPDARGKYLVFCANREHMEKIRVCAAQWFGGIDAQPHIYEVYAESAQAREAFRQFKEDDSDHLKLLYCIDMLNEGVHVDNLSGVVLCRTTVSPIVYKQQIGRALSAAADSMPVIFDLVNNVDNLYSISAVRKEMEELITFYANENRDDEIVNSGFELIDEVRDCRELFEQLEETLSASWEMMYAEAVAYFREHGHLDIPKRYKTDANLCLGTWLQTQRMVRSGTRMGVLTAEQIAKLDQIGMQWKNVKELSWERGFEHAKAYFDEHGDLDVKSRYICEDGFALGNWICRMRKMKTGMQRGDRLTEKQAARLAQLGMIWNRRDEGFERGYAVSEEYFIQHGDLRVPRGYVTETGYKLGIWLSTLKSKRESLTVQQQKQMERIGFDWDGRHAERWNNAYREAARYYEQHGHINVPRTYRVDDMCLGRWVIRQRQMLAEGRLNTEQIRRLAQLGMSA